MKGKAPEPIEAEEEYTVFPADEVELSETTTVFTRKWSESSPGASFSIRYPSCADGKGPAAVRSRFCS